MAKGQSPPNKKYDKDRLTAMLEAGITRDIIAAEFDVKPDTIRTWITYKLKRPEFLLQGGVRSQVDDEMVAELLDKRLGTGRIARRLDVNPRTISRARKRIGRASNRGIHPPHPQEYLDKAEALLNDNAPMAEVARTLKVGDKWVREHFPGRGWTQEQTNEFNRAKRLARKAGVEL